MSYETSAIVRQSSTLNSYLPAQLLQQDIATMQAILAGVQDAILKNLLTGREQL